MGYNGILTPNGMVGIRDHAHPYGPGWYLTGLLDPRSLTINRYQPAKAPPCVPGRYNIVVNVLSKQSQAQLRSRAWSCRHFTAGGSGGKDPHEILGVVVVQCKLDGILSEMF
jgi:hypothetical protein